MLYRVFDLLRFSGGRGVVLELLSPLSLTGTSFSRSPYKRKKAPGSCRGLSPYARISLTRFSTAAASQPELFSWAAMSWASLSAAFWASVWPSSRMVQ